MSDRVVQITFTIDSEAGAARVVRLLLEERLVACGQVDGPVTSVYRWKGAVQTAVEWRVVLKTAGERSAAVVARVHREHAYEVPEILVTPVTGGDPDYLAWVVEESSPGE